VVGGDEAWLAAASSLAANLHIVKPDVPPRWFQFGDAFLDLRADLPAFTERFSALFGGCRAEGPCADAPVVMCRVTRRPGDDTPVTVMLDGPAFADAPGLVEALFAEDGLRRTTGFDGWTGFAFEGMPAARLAVRDDRLVASPESPWPYVAGAVLVHSTMCAQPDTLFVHAAAVRIGGAGVLFVGSRLAGKTTLAVGLATRGHRMLSDEVGAIRLGGPSILPFPRAAGVRPGPAAAAAAAVLDRPEFLVERFADGTTKTLVPFAAFGPAVPLGEPTPLEHVVVLDQRAERPRLTELDPSPRNLRFVSPVKSAPFAAGSAAKTMRLVTLASKVRWHRLEAGSPDETLTVIERRFDN